MRRATAVTIWIVIAAAVAAIVVGLVLRARRWNASMQTIQGAVIREDGDPSRRLPVSDAEIKATRGAITVTTESDASGYFKINFPEVIWPGQTVLLHFAHPDFKPLDIPLQIRFRSTTKRLIVAAMDAKPSSQQAAEKPGQPLIVVSNIRVRYTENSQNEENIGSLVRMFQVVNRSNVPCRHQAPCSPDGNWKASTASLTVDAGLGNEFRNVRASCIAGPCPFTRIDSSGFAQGGRTIVAAATDWSDTATFLLEAEVFRTSIGSSVRHSYPLIFERTLNFTLPPTQEGVTIEADINGAPMVFPLGPALFLSWATCTARTSTDVNKSTAYRCELKPGYQFGKDVAQGGANFQ